MLEILHDIYGKTFIQTMIVHGQAFLFGYQTPVKQDHVNSFNPLTQVW